MPSEETPLNDLVDDITENEPSVNEAVVEHLQSKGNENGNGDGSENTNTSGNAASESATGSPVANNVSSGSGGKTVGAFDPSIHATDSNGNPILKADGTYAKKRGRKKGVSYASVVNSGGAGSDGGDSGRAGTASGVGTQAATGTGTEKAQVNYPQLARYMTGVGFMGAESLLGPAWRPTPAEDEQITFCTARYLEHLGVDDIPPGMALCIVVGMYALPRINDPETRNRLAKWGLVKPPKVAQPEQEIPVQTVAETVKVETPPPQPPPTNNGSFSFSRVRNN